MNGPPQYYRWSAWKTLLLSENLEFCKPNLYERRLEKLSKDANAIEKDMDRTLSTHSYFD